MDIFYVKSFTCIVKLLLKNRIGSHDRKIKMDFKLQMQIFFIFFHRYESVN